MTELIICTTCRTADAPRESPPHGAALFEAVMAAQQRGLATSVQVRGVACLSSCSRACSVALQAPGKYTYLFGGLVPDAQTAEHVLLCAGMHAAASNGDLPRSERPERLRSGIVARLPPRLAVGCA